MYSKYIIWLFVLIIRNMNIVCYFNLCFYFSINRLTLFTLCFSVPYNISIQIWRHTVISGLNSHVCSLSAVYFECWCIFCKRFCYLWHYLSCHHDTWWVECCHTSLFELGISAACHWAFTKMTYMMCDLWTCTVEDDAHLKVSDMKVLKKKCNQRIEGI